MAIVYPSLVGVLQGIAVDTPVRHDCRHGLSQRTRVESRRTCSAKHNGHSTRYISILVSWYEGKTSKFTTHCTHIIENLKFLLVFCCVLKAKSNAHKMRVKRWRFSLLGIRPDPVSNKRIKINHTDPKPDGFSGISWDLMVNVSPFWESVPPS